MSDFYGILTTAGAAVCAQSIETGLDANITTFSIGDGNGSIPQPNAAQTELVNPVFTGPLNSLMRDRLNPAILIAEAVLPAASGPFWIREMGIKTADGVLVAVCSLPPQYKVATEQGASGTMVIRMNVIFTEGANVTLLVDDSAVLATRNYVDQSVEDGMAAHLAEDDPHPQYAKKDAISDALELHEQEADGKYLQIGKNFAEIYAAGANARTAAKANLEIPKDITDGIKKHTTEADPHEQYLETDKLLSEIAAKGKTAQRNARSGIGVTDDMFYGRFIKRTIFTASGTWMMDVNTRVVRVQAQAAGGGGGIAPAVESTSYASLATGGVGGEYAEQWQVRNNDGSPFSVIVGAGGEADSQGGVTRAPFLRQIAGGPPGKSVSFPISGAPRKPALPWPSTGYATEDDYLSCPGGLPDDIIFFSKTITAGGKGGDSMLGAGGALGSTSSAMNGIQGGGGAGAVNLSTASAANGGRGGDGVVIIDEYT